MKKGIITMMMLMLGMSGMMAQRTLVVAGAGDVTLKQGDVLEIKSDGSPITFTNDQKIVLSSYRDYDVTIPELRELKVTGAGDVECKNKLTMPCLDILVSGAGDANLTVECDTIKAVLSGVGDLTLNGHCHYLEATVSGLGDLEFNNFIADSLNISKTPRGKSDWEWEYSSDNGSRRVYKSLLFDPHWEGVDAGLNMLFVGNDPNALLPTDYSLLELRPLKSWNFNFNIAGVGVAFNRTHSVGMYTGIGLGWNNYSFNTPTRLEKGDQLICNAIDEATEGAVRRSKLGVLYLQAPLMVEVRPTRHFYVALGATAGFRVDTWTKVKFKDSVAIKTHNDYWVNRFKLDASLRAGSSDFGFYASYNLLPLFAKDKAPEVHTFSFGLSLNF